MVGTRIRTMSKYVESGYEGLALAIVRQAVYDYRNNPKYRGEVEDFVQSPWFEVLVDVRPDKFLKLLKTQ